MKTVIYLIAAAVLLATAIAIYFTGNRPFTSDTADTADTASTAGMPGTNPQIISPEEAKKRLDSEERIILLDVREYDEYVEIRIPGSLLMPLDTIEARASAELPDKDQVIFVYCRSGRRSAIAAEKLASLGYTNVYDMGGIIDWPYETESGEVQIISIDI